MGELWSRRRNLPAPPHVVFGDLTAPTRNTIRTWLHLLDDEVAPMVLERKYINVLINANLRGTYGQ